MDDFTYRFATRADLDQIVAIYNKTIPSRQVTADLDPVTVQDREPWFKSFDQVHHGLWVIENDQHVVGWISLGSFNSRLAYRYTAEVSVYLDESVRGHHLGTRTLKFAEQQAKQMGIHTIVSLVFAHNQPSQGLFTKMGYEKWGHLPKVADMDNNEYDLDYFGKPI
ncbi:acetyltransferase [Secundilactobacillus oryzae JCM 18671]|uniref:Acetyltransferase n=1 Tax=Secundilactobacillus oryzae JCM 18671 TaxID=1291743 RepID=A0A081BKR4_9LACO|nr:GNAT family N-acetyltransferase [Secundilactobacillus oryzae]GAK48632.1 acetyltransferase [Secundilactobacillus oryzae JCM 18671]